MSTPIWPYGPTQNRVVERLQWRTRMHQNADGSERRERVRMGPRRFSEWTHQFLDVSERRRYDQTRYEHGSGPYVVPLWWDVITALGLAGDSAIVLPLGTLDTREFIVGAYAAMRNNRGEWHASVISGIVETSSFIVLELETAFDLEFFSLNIKVYPAGVAHLSPSTASTSITSHYEQIAVSVEYDKPAPLPAAASGESFENINIFPYRPNQPVNWQSTDQTVDAERIDSGVGVWSVLDEWGEPLDVRTQEYRFVSDRESLWLYKRWLQRQGGRHLEFWAPTWNADLEVTDITATGTTGQYVITFGDDFDWSAIYDGRDSRECIYLRTRDGDQAGRITAPVVGTGETTLTVDFEDPLATTDVGKVIQCHWLELVRLAFDEVTITHRTTEVAFMRLSLKQLKEEAA